VLQANAWRSPDANQALTPLDNDLEYLDHGGVTGGNVALVCCTPVRSRSGTGNPGGTTESHSETSFGSMQSTVIRRLCAVFPADFPAAVLGRPAALAVPVAEDVQYAALQIIPSRQPKPSAAMGVHCMVGAGRSCMALGASSGGTHPEAEPRVIIRCTVCVRAIGGSAF